MARSFDFVIIGAGIAGASLAWALAPHGRVALLEAEARAGMHATGRSAALFHLIYGGPAIQPLSRATLAFFNAPPAGFAETPLLTARPLLIVAAEADLPQLREQASQAPDAYEIITPAQALALFPALRPEYAAAGAIDNTSADIDVDALHQGFLRGGRALGVEFFATSPVTAMTHDSAGWTVRAGGEDFSAPVVINGAGAWADQVAALAGVAPVGLQPKRRTAALIEAPEGSANWPFLVTAKEDFYVKPSSGQMLLSPADETNVEPHDAFADDVALAEGVERMEAVTTLTVTKRPITWAGLRTFAPDRIPVIGYEPGVPGFFWLAGQGGFGVQTSAAVAQLAASLVVGAALPANLAAAGVDPATYAPARLRKAQGGS